MVVITHIKTLVLVLTRTTDLHFGYPLGGTPLLRAPQHAYVPLEPASQPVEWLCHTLHMGQGCIFSFVETDNVNRSMCASSLVPVLWTCTPNGD